MVGRQIVRRGYQCRCVLHTCTVIPCAVDLSASTRSAGGEAGLGLVHWLVHLVGLRWGFKRLADGFRLLFRSPPRS